MILVLIGIAAAIIILGIACIIISDYDALETIGIGGCVSEVEYV